MASAATEAAKSALSGYKALGSNTALESANKQYDVGGSQTRLSALKGIVGNLQSSVEAVDPSVTGRTSGTFTTEGQRQALVSKERAPILGDLNKQQSAYTSEQGDLTQKQTLAGQMASALINDDKSKYQRLLDQYNRSAAEDTAAEQRRQAELQQQQWEKQFAESQRQYNETLANSKAQAAAARAVSSSSSAQPSVQEKVRAMLDASVGDDGKVSPAKWRQLAAYAYDNGLKFGGNDGFASKFWQYANERNWKDYQLGYDKYMK